jgi:hypothetical protein
MFSHCESVIPKTMIGTVEEFCTYRTCAGLSPTPSSVKALTRDAACEQERQDQDTGHETGGGSQ